LYAFTVEGEANGREKISRGEQGGTRKNKEEQKVSSFGTEAAGDGGETSGECTSGIKKSHRRKEILGESSSSIG